MSAFNGTWIASKGENMAAFAKATGLKLPEDATEEAVNNMKAEQTIKVDGDSVYLKVASPLLNFEKTFKLGEMTEFERPSGETAQTKMTIEGDVMTQHMVCGDMKVHATSEIKDNHLVIVHKFGDIVATRWYHKA